MRSEFARLAEAQTATQQPAPKATPATVTARLTFGRNDGSRRTIRSPSTQRLSHRKQADQVRPLAAASAGRCRSSAGLTQTPTSVKANGARRPPRRQIDTGTARADLSPEPDPVENSSAAHGCSAAIRWRASVPWCSSSGCRSSPGGRRTAPVPPELRLAAVGIVGPRSLVQGFRLSRRVPVGDNGDEIAAQGTMRICFKALASRCSI